MKINSQRKENEEFRNKILGNQKLPVNEIEKINHIPIQNPPFIQNSPQDNYSFSQPMPNAYNNSFLPQINPTENNESIKSIMKKLNQPPQNSPYNPKILNRLSQLEQENIQLKRK